MPSRNPIFLSYPYTSTLPVYGNPTFILPISQEKSLDNGDSCNTYTVTLPNHSGTHMDAPAHFLKNGQRLSDYTADAFIFNAPFLLTVSAQPGELITLSQFQIDSLPPETDLVILKTGFCHQRQHPDYALNNPGIHQENAEKLIQRCPHLRALGMDLISLSSFKHRLHGREAHHAFLGRNILLIEDMDLTQLESAPKQVFAVPLRVADIDSAPCTIIALP